ncbi:hypothetical protein HK100_010661, partial [Physocladia obscura]
MPPLARTAEQEEVYAKRPRLEQQTQQQSNSGDSTESPSFQAQCKWKIAHDELCGLVFGDPDLMFAHLAEAHVGQRRKRVSLDCSWDGCPHAAKPFSKRDHIISHFR